MSGLESLGALIHPIPRNVNVNKLEKSTDTNEQPKKRKRKASTSTANAEIKRRLSVKTEDRPFKCKHPGCNKSFAWKWSMETHARTHLGDEGRTYKCKFCGKGFFTPGCLKSHTKIHTRKEKSYVCKAPGCTKTYSTAEGLRLHIRNHHEIDKKWKCQVEGCTRSFVRHADLRLHTIRIHSKTRPFPCSVPGCKKAFACFSELKRHLQCHTKPRKNKNSTYQAPVEKHCFPDFKEEYIAAQALANMIA